MRRKLLMLVPSSHEQTLLWSLSLHFTQLALIMCRRALRVVLLLFLRGVLRPSREEEVQSRPDEQTEA